MIEQWYLEEKLYVGLSLGFEVLKSSYTFVRSSNDP